MKELEQFKKGHTDLEGLEKDLRKELVSLRDFIENASIPLHWVNGSGIIIWVNRAELDLLGYSKNEVLNQHISKLHADKDVIENILRKLLNKETLMNYPARLVCKSGEIKEVLINSNVYWENGQFVHTRCFTRDITLLRKIEKEKETLIKELEGKIVQLEDENKVLKSKLYS
jgi:PAS domain S-box-containing protein